ncbi:polysaccharide pyruvyl transferase family protein [Kribbella jejuensis]|uniref:Polysaccharide pyruvyl transferase n=1 Tax=Kribbella jejuensis TaxID=236068 RepID=A0A542ERQ5_9ACTN|nr:polysaccharide pyruvyl transferase family protein [Kribbella jejuensis]TQJ18033.1 polysaccharide pyruvyl transferase [Kribbella jejuensis]
MYWWRPDPPYRGNFGDELGPYLVGALFGLRVEWAEPDACEIATVGTVIEMMLSSKGENRPALWGSGLFLTATDTISAGEFQIAALRGRLTRERIADLDSDVALGDPGLLAYVLVEPLPRKQHELGIVPHFLDAELPLVAQLRGRPGVTIVDVTKPAPEVVRDIARCHYVLSSSLHGLVVADSIGTPNAYVPLSNDPRIGGSKKFLDYYSVFTDPARQVILPLSEVMSRDTASITSEIERRYRVPADLKAIADRLVKAFPG